MGERSIVELRRCSESCTDHIAVVHDFDVVVVRMYNTVVRDFPKISGKLRACANSGYQALSFSGGRGLGTRLTLGYIGLQRHHLLSVHAWTYCSGAFQMPTRTSL